MFIVETISLHVISFLFASSGLDERQEDDLPDAGQDMKPKMVLVQWYPQLLHLKGCLHRGTQSFVIMLSVKHFSPNSNKSCICVTCVCFDSVSLISFKYK